MCLRQEKDKKERKMSEKTKWQGLWNNREGVYSGKVIKKSDIPAYSRLIVRYNKFYEKDGSKPRFVYCFANGDSAKAITMECDHDEYRTLKELNSKIDELKDVMRQGKENGYMMALPSQSQAAAADLMQRAIEIIEEITGEEWDFSYITF